VPPLTLTGAIGDTELDAELAELPTPIPVFVVIVKVYEVPFVSPVTTIGLLDPVPVNPPGLDVTV
jgi:hypothetical protein